MNRLLISGASGRMGQHIAALSRQYRFITVAGIDVHPIRSDTFPIYSSYALCKEEADVLIDFSKAPHLQQTLEFALERRLPLVIGTTGLESVHEGQIDQAAQHIPILQSANFSPAMQVMQQLCQLSAQQLSGFDIEIIERHHAQKTDAPGGTALMLFNALATPSQHATYGRHTALQKRDQQEIGLHAVRGGTLCGTHEVGFYGKCEHLCITHTAEDRSVFAHGALQSARWLLSQPPGRYNSSDPIKKRE